MIIHRRICDLIHNATFARMKKTLNSILLASALLVPTMLSAQNRNNLCNSYDPIRQDLPVTSSSSPAGALLNRYQKLSTTLLGKQEELYSLSETSAMKRIVGGSPMGLVGGLFYGSATRPTQKPLIDNSEEKNALNAEIQELSRELTEVSDALGKLTLSEIEKNRFAELSTNYANRSKSLYESSKEGRKAMKEQRKEEKRQAKEEARAEKQRAKEITKSNDSQSAKELNDVQDDDVSRLNAAKQHLEEVRAKNQQ